MAYLNKAQLTSKVTSEDGEVFDITTQSNTNRTNNVEKDITLTKAISKNWALPDQELTSTTTITNNSSLSISNITIQDTLGDDATFKSGSLKIGSVDYPNENPITGFTLPIDISALGGEMIMTYNFTVNNHTEKNSISNSSELAVTLDNKNFNLTSNVAEVQIINNEVSMYKYASSSAVISGDTLTYTIEITNDGTFENTDLVFKDELPEGVSFVEGTVKVDGVTQADANPVNGFSLRNLTANDTIKVEFNVIID